VLSGGRTYFLYALVKNSSDKAAIDLTGKVAILDSDGVLVDSSEAIGEGVLPRGRTIVWTETDLDPGKRYRFRWKVSAASLQPGPKRSPVTFTNVEPFKSDMGCGYRGLVTTSFKKEYADGLALVVAGFSKGKLVYANTGGPNQLLPGTKARFEASAFDFCPPPNIDRVEVFPDLSEAQLSD